MCDNAARALELAKSERFDLMMSDVVMPGKDGLALLEDLRAAGIALPVVMISGQANIEMAVRATRLGAIDFLEKPLSTEKLLLTVDNVLKLKRLEEENRDLRQRVGKHEIVHTGEAMRRVMAQVDRVASSETRVCILGETGTGKELIARALHDRSQRGAGPFVTLNCAAVPGELIESELFGHEKGSFTGAASRHLGKFEQAHHGTLFLDEIGDMPLVMQAKLLRVLEERQMERVGGDRAIPVDVRVVVATHRNLEESGPAGGVSRGPVSSRLRFSRLRCRLYASAATIFARWRNISCGNWRSRIIGSRRDFRRRRSQRLVKYPWPGNVRELRNVIERLLLLADGDIIGAADGRTRASACRSLGAGRANGDGGAEERTFDRGAVPAAWRPSSAKVCSPNSRNTTIT